MLKKGVGGVASAPPQPLAVAGLLLAMLSERKVLCEKSFLRRELQKARHDTRIHFSAPC